MAAQVNLLAGPVRSHKTDSLLRQYRQALISPKAIAASAESLWIGPDHHTVALVRDSLLASAEEAYLGLNFLTFAGYAESVVAAGARQIRPISGLQKRRVLQAAVAQAVGAGQVVHYAQVAKTPGFLAQTSELIAELKRRDVWPKDFAPRCREQREHELAAIFERYQQYLLDYDLYDAEGRFWAARDLLSKQTSSGSNPEYTLVVVDGFTDFTSAQYDILRQLAEKSAEMQISLTLEQPPADSLDQVAGRSLLFAKAAETLRRLRQIFPDMQISIKGTSHFAAPGLQHLAKHLFCEPHEIASTGIDSAGIKILAASSAEQELDKVAQRIKGLIRTGQARPHEIALVFRSLEELSPRIRETLADHGIPYLIESQTRLIATPLLRSIFSLLRLRAEDWPFRHLLEVVSNRMFRLLDNVPGNVPDDGEEKSGDLRATLERCIRSAQLPAGRQALFDQLQRWIEAKESTSTATARRAVEAGVSLWQLQRLAERLDHLPQEAPLSKWIRQLQAVLVELGVLLDKHDANTANQATWQALQRGLRAIESLDVHIETSTPSQTIFDFIEILETVARDQRLSAEYDPTGRVRVLSSETARHISAKYLFLAGLGEQSFASVASGNPLFDVRRFDRQAAGHGGTEIGQESLNGESMQLFYELATRASHQLTLSYAAMDAKGQTLSASPLLVELKRCFGSVAIHEEKPSLGDFVRTDSEPQSETAFRQQAIARALQGNHRWLAGLLSEPGRATVAQAIVGGIHCIAERGKREEFGVYEGLILGNSARKVLAQRFDSEHLWSASQLENYATCPFRFFGEQLLSLEAPEELALRSDAMRRGSLLHQVLATLHQHVEGMTGEEKSDDENTAEDPATELARRFHRALQQAIDAAPLYGLQQALREIERREIEALAPKYAQQEVDYRGRWRHLDQPPVPQFFEVRFGPKTWTGGESDDSGSSALPFELDLGEERILLTGQIDRVDVGRVGGITVFNIIDYKSGKEVKLKVEKVQSGQQLQLPLYAMAAEHLLLADQNAMALTTGYWSVAGKGFPTGRGGALEVRQLEAGDLQTSPQWDELQPVLLQRVRELVRGIREGQFPVYNADENCTRSCTLATICRVAHIRSLEKEWVPPKPPTNV